MARKVNPVQIDISRILTLDKGKKTGRLAADSEKRRLSSPEILAKQSSVQTDISWILVRKILADTIEDQLR